MLNVDPMTSVTVYMGRNATKCLGIVMEFTGHILVDFDYRYWEKLSRPFPFLFI